MDYLENFRVEIEKLIEPGYDENSIIKNMAKREVAVVKRFTFGNVSYANMIRAAYRSIKKDAPAR